MKISHFTFLEKTTSLPVKRKLTILLRLEKLPFKTIKGICVHCTKSQHLAKLNQTNCLLRNSIVCVANGSKVISSCHNHALFEKCTKPAFACLTKMRKKSVEGFWYCAKKEKLLKKEMLLFNPEIITNFILSDLCSWRGFWTIRR